MGTMGCTKGYEREHSRSFNGVMSQYILDRMYATVSKKEMVAAVEAKAQEMVAAVEAKETEIRHEIFMGERKRIRTHNVCCRTEACW